MMWLLSASIDTLGRCHGWFDEQWLVPFWSHDTDDVITFGYGLQGRPLFPDPWRVSYDRDV